MAGVGPEQPGPDAPAGVRRRLAVFQRSVFGCEHGHSALTTDGLEAEYDVAAVRRRHHLCRGRTVDPVDGWRACPLQSVLRPRGAIARTIVIRLLVVLDDAGRDPALAEPTGRLRSDLGFLRWREFPRTTRRLLPRQYEQPEWRLSQPRHAEPARAARLSQRSIATGRAPVH